MWETPFDTAMLADSRIIVNCPNENFVQELMDVLAANGVVWQGGREAPSKYNSRWNEHKEGTCYWIEKYKMAYESMEYAEDHEFEDYIRCTFCGISDDFEPASDGELMAFLGL